MRHKFLAAIQSSACRLLASLAKQAKCHTNSLLCDHWPAHLSCGVLLIVRYETGGWKFQKVPQQPRHQRQLWKVYHMRRQGVLQLRKRQDTLEGGRIWQPRCCSALQLQHSDAHELCIPYVQQHSILPMCVLMRHALCESATLSIA